jgi:hypothetical protein
MKVIDLIVETFFDVILTVMFAVFLYLVIRKPSQNHYSKVATIELTVALFSRIILAIYFHVWGKQNLKLEEYRF